MKVFDRIKYKDLEYILIRWHPKIKDDESLKITINRRGDNIEYRRNLKSLNETILKYQDQITNDKAIQVILPGGTDIDMNKLLNYFPFMKSMEVTEGKFVGHVIKDALLNNILYLKIYHCGTRNIYW